MNTRTFEQNLQSTGVEPLKARGIETLQVNLGYRCNLSCKHCHVSGGPGQTAVMNEETADAVLRVFADSPIETIDLTGGAPELNSRFRTLVAAARSMGRRVIVRTNLAIFYEPGMDDLPVFYRDHGVELIASVPYYLEDNVDRVRGSGTFRKIIAALGTLNELGYGTAERALSLVYNPQGAFLAPDQESLEKDYKRELGDRFGISFTRLYTFTNMPIGRFKDFLQRTGNLDKYLNKLSCAFNAQTLDNVMCRTLLSVGWDGALYDCDFNHVLGLPVAPETSRHIHDFNYSALVGRTIAVGDHCYGCTAGQGSS